MKIMKFLLPILAMLIILGSCNNSTSPGGKNVPKPVTGLVIMNGSTPIANGGTIPIEEGAQLALTAVLEPSGITGTVSWSSDDSAIATVTPASGLAVTINGITQNSALITVTA